MEDIYILNGIGTLGTWSVSDFSSKIFLAFFSSLFKYFFSLHFWNLFYFSLGLVPNIDLEYTTFFNLLQYFVKFSGRDISVDIGYMI